jgi:hypothetical protein
MTEIIGDSLNGTRIALSQAATTHPRPGMKP